MRAVAEVPAAVLKEYETYRLMRLFRLSHPRQLAELPASLVLWAPQFERVENEARAAKSSAPAPEGVSRIGG